VALFASGLQRSDAPTAAMAAGITATVRRFGSTAQGLSRLLVGVLRPDPQFLPPLCGMKAEGPEGRACGSIAKVRRYRQRQR
jgi:hypothetical protein